MIDHIDGWWFEDSVLDGPHVAPRLIDVLPMATTCLVSRVRGFGCRPYWPNHDDGVFACDYLYELGGCRDAAEPLARLAQAWSSADVEELVLFVLRMRKRRAGKCSISDTGWWSNVRAAAAMARASAYAYASSIPYCIAECNRDYVKRKILTTAELCAKRDAMDAELAAAITSLFK